MEAHRIKIFVGAEYLNVLTPEDAKMASAQEEVFFCVAFSTAGRDVFSRDPPAHRHFCFSDFSISLRTAMEMVE